MPYTHPTRSATRATFRAIVPMMDRALKHAIPRSDLMVVCLVSSVVSSSVLDFGWLIQSRSRERLGQYSSRSSVRI
jgi:hypothetical protein